MFSVSLSNKNACKLQQDWMTRQASSFKKSGKNSVFKMADSDSPVVRPSRHSCRTLCHVAPGFLKLLSMGNEVAEWFQCVAPKHTMSICRWQLTLEALVRSQLHAAHRRCWINWPKGPWALPRKMVCGTLGACTLNNPRRTSNLERGLSAGLVVSTKLFTLVGGA